MIFPGTVFAFALGGFFDRIDFVPAHKLKRVATPNQLGHGIKPDNRPAITHGGTVLQLFFKTINKVKVVVLANFVRSDADDLPGTPSQIDQTFVADDHLYRFNPALSPFSVFSFGVKRHQVGMPKNRVWL